MINNSNDNNLNTMQELHIMMLTCSKMKVNTCSLLAAPERQPVETLGGRNTFDNDDAREQKNRLPSFIS